jgi:hypothetical protein
MSPRPLEAGDQAHLTEGTLRWSIARQMRLAASVTLDATGRVPPEYVRLLAGVPVVLTREQVASFVPPDRRPPTLDRHALWVLEGDDRLKVYRRRKS